MLRNIKLSVDQVYIDPSSSLLHVGTSYQVSPTPDFSVIGDLILNINNDANSKLEHTFQHDMLPNAPIYARTRYHFNNSTASDWSAAIELSGSQVGLKSSSTIVGTPTMDITYDTLDSSTGEIVAKLNQLSVITGIGNVDTVSWTVESLDGIILYELPKSTDAISELRLPVSIINGHKAVIITAIANTNTNASSNPARDIAIINPTDISYFTGTMRGGLYNNWPNYILITNPVETFDSMDVRVNDANGALVDSFSYLNSQHPEFRTPTLNINEYYTVEARGYNGGRYTPWMIVYVGIAIKYSVRSYNNNIRYNLGYMGFGGYINFEGMSTQSAHSDEDNVFYLAVPGTDRLDAYKSLNGTIYATGNSYNMAANSMAKIPNMNYIMLASGDVLIDHAIESGSGPREAPRFSFKKYNHVTKVLTAVHGLTRSDERYGTGHTNAAVSTDNGLLYYVPGRIVDGSGASLDLEMRVYDVAQNTIVDHIPLPVSGLKLNVTIAEDINHDIYMYGGTSDMTENATHGEWSATMLNHSVYKLDKAAKTWAVLNTTIPHNSSSFRYRMQTLLGGSIMIVDVTPDIIGTSARSSYRFNPILDIGVDVVPNNPSKEHIGITIDLANGDMGAMSSTPEVVESLSYISTTVSDAHLTATSLTASQPVTNLVIPVGKTIYIRDPYRYASIDIQGNGMGNTGTLVWIRDDVPTSYHYNDLIVTRNMTITDPLSGSQTVYNRIVVVGDAKLTVVQA
jgi:hypothetical protein